MAVRPTGLDVLVNTRNAGTVTFPDVTRLVTGGYIVAWIANGNGQLTDGSGASVEGQVFDPSGNKVGTEFTLNATTQGNQFLGDIEAVPNGGFNAVWTTITNTYVVQRFDNLGNRIGAEITGNAVNPNDNGIALTTFTGGPFVTAAPLNDDISVRGQDGLGSGLGGIIVDGGGLDFGPTLTTLGPDRFLLMWQQTVANDTNVAGQIFRYSGQPGASLFEPLTDRFTVNTTIAGSQYLQSGAALGDGSFVAVWVENGINGTSGGIRGQIFSAAGAKVGAELAISSLAPNSQSSPDVVALSWGGFLTTWTDSSGTDGDRATPSVRAQLFDSDGSRIGDEIRINSRIDQSEQRPKLTVLDDQHAVAVWSASGSEGSGIYQRMLALPVAGSLGNDMLNAAATGGDLAGRAGDDTLNGSIAADVLDGGTGNDTYAVDNVGDVVVEAANVGSDTILSSVSYTLAANLSVEILSSITNSATTGIALRGNTLSQFIIGDYGNNQLSGGGDVLIGLRGDDSYTVESTQMFLIENANEGNDVATITFAASNFVLNANSSVEILQAAAGTDAINITGSPDSQTIIGNAGNNILSTGSGAADTLIGGLGDDTYRVFGGIDTIVEAPGQGLDRVFVSGNSVAINSGASIEYISVSVQADTGSFYLVGNEFTQVIVGNYGDNTLDGNSGNSGNADTMIGLVGNDVYRVNMQADVVLEAVGQGNDTVLASTSYQLRRDVSVENLSAVSQTATDTASQYTLRGNESPQVVVGNDAANTLDGRGGTDVLIGRGGVDVFAYTVAPGPNNFVSTDFVAGVDKIGLASDIFAAVTAGGITADEFTLGPAKDGDDRLVYDQTIGFLYYDVDANGPGASVRFMQFVAGTPLTAADFVVLAPVSDLPG